ncbi:MAG TPA: glycerol-3-phosphate 1-O-acyltransferase PlsY [Thermoanaerobaculia bacterium]|jgi:glycerol-3-phosphate acyltransferase PlsY|nr:glycerol-3-phosphate 1-O-acyltransferase PlsY [Thermoanaerobaculia bacterium]
MRLAVGIVILAYFLGSIPFSYLIVKLKTHKDVRSVGSGNVGATNAMRAAGKGAGIAALLLDIGKGVAAVLIARRLGATPALVGAAAFFVMLGHCYPVWLKFQGGKGVATSAGAMGALAPPAMALTLLAFLIVLAWKRYVSLGSMTAAVSFVWFVFITQRLGWEDRDPALLLAATLIGLFIVWKHRPNIERIRQGLEPRLGERRAG